MIAFILRKPIDIMTNLFVWCISLTLLLAMWLYQSSIVFLLAVISVGILGFITYRQVRHARLDLLEKPPEKKMNWLEEKRGRELKQSPATDEFSDFSEYTEK
jgi:hypothetical protein